MDRVDPEADIRAEVVWRRRGGAHPLVVRVGNSVMRAWFWRWGHLDEGVDHPTAALSLGGPSCTCPEVGASWFSTPIRSSQNHMRHRDFRVRARD